MESFFGGGGAMSDWMGLDTDTDIAHSACTTSIIIYLYLDPLPSPTPFFPSQRPRIISSSERKFHTTPSLPPTSPPTAPYPLKSTSGGGRGACVTVWGGGGGGYCRYRKRRCRRCKRSRIYRRRGAHRRWGGTATLNWIREECSIENTAEHTEATNGVLKP